MSLNASEKAKPELPASRQGWQGSAVHALMVLRAAAITLKGQMSSSKLCKWQEVQVWLRISAFHSAESSACVRLLTPMVLFTSSPCAGVFLLLPAAPAPGPPPRRQAGSGRQVRAA